MKTIKLTTPWPHDYYSQTPRGKGIYKNFTFEINNGCNKCDFWIIWGGLEREEKVKVKSGLVIYITDEAHDQRKFNEEFLNQFQVIASVRKDLDKQILIPIHEFAPWYLKKTYDYLFDLKPPPKTRSIAVISSNLSWLSGHKKRLDFVNALMSQFNGTIDLFGHGFNEVEDKYDALIDYKYSIAIENNSLPGYFTEKISECFLTYTMPVYYGCPDIENYYDKRSFVSIDINNYDSAFKKIGELLTTDPYSRNLSFIEESRRRYLTEYHIFPAMIKLVERIMHLYPTPNKKINVVVVPENNRYKDSSDSQNQEVARSSKILKRLFKPSNR